MMRPSCSATRGTTRSMLIPSVNSRITSGAVTLLFR